MVVWWDTLKYTIGCSCLISLILLYWLNWFDCTVGLRLLLHRGEILLATILLVKEKNS